MDVMLYLHLTTINRFFCQSQTAPVEYKEGYTCKMTKWENKVQRYMKAVYCGFPEAHNFTQIMEMEAYLH